MYKLKHFMLTIYLLVRYCTSEPMDKNDAMTYLKTFGYMKNQTESLYEEGLKRFQKYAGIMVTGKMDEQTRQVMTMPRCGSDTVDIGLKGSFHGSKWKISEITYRILNYTESLEKEKVDEVVGKAFNEWSKFAKISFVKILSGNSIINITFLPLAIIGGMNSITFVGTAKYPIFGGEIHINSLLNWDADSLYQVTLHEIGHSLGLLHSSYPNSIMSPYFMDGNTQLHPNDKKKIKILYGTPIEGLTTKTNVSICEIDKLDAIISYKDNEIYVFNGDHFWLLEAWTNNIVFTSTYPRTISSRWTEISGNIDTAYVDYHGNTYFFKGNEYWKYKDYNTLDAGYPKNISTDFPGIPNDLDAATEWDDETLYFFKGAKYWQYDKDRKPSISVGYPKSISELGSHIPNDTDAVLYFRLYNNEIYFFKDMLYYKYDQNNLPAIRKFPRNTAFWWFNC